MKNTKYEILNLYACLGGNRLKFDEISNQIGFEIQVTAVELDPELGKLYKERFPNDIVIISDAHEYLLKNYQNFDFIWSSPLCPTHSRARFWGIGSNGKDPVFPDMTLYQEIIFLKHHFKGKYCVENVIPYYQPLMDPEKRGRHLYWTNFKLPKTINERQHPGREKDEIKKLSIYHDYDFMKYKGDQRRDKIARNLVDYEAGKTILMTSLKVVLSNKIEQQEMKFN